MLAAGLTPLVPYPGNDEPWLSKHDKCNNEVSPHFNSIQQGGGGCGFCSGRTPDMERVLAEMAAAGLEPLVPYPGANAPWLCKHDKCNNEVRPRYSHIQQGGGGCGFCSGRATDPEIVLATMLAAGFEPLEPYPGSRIPWRCKHTKCGQEVKPCYTTIQQGGGGCFVCGRCVDPEIAVATMLAAGFEPLEPYPGSRIPWRCKHTKCGQEVKPRYITIQRKRGHGCRFCAPRRYDPSKPGCVYLIELDSHIDFPHGVLKVGATGSRTRRLKDWQLRGWSLLEEFHFDDGKIPLTIEAEVLTWLEKDLGLEPCLSDDVVGSMGGSSETVSVADLTEAGVSVDDVRKKVQQLVKLQSPQLVAGGVR